jgi:integrase/recombinase XerD
MLDLISAYENYLTKVKQASANTVFSYMRDIRQFDQWLTAGGTRSVLDADQVNIAAYLDHLHQQGRSAATVSRSLASLKNFYAYLVATGFLCSIVKNATTHSCTQTTRITLFSLFKNHVV